MLLLMLALLLLLIERKRMNDELHNSSNSLSKRPHDGSLRATKKSDHERLLCSVDIVQTIGMDKKRLNRMESDIFSKKFTKYWLTLNVKVLKVLEREIICSVKRQGNFSLIINSLPLVFHLIQKSIIVKRVVSNPLMSFDLNPQSILCLNEISFSLKLGQTLVLAKQEKFHAAIDDRRKKFQEKKTISGKTSEETETQSQEWFFLFHSSTLYLPFSFRAPVKTYLKMKNDIPTVSFSKTFNQLNVKLKNWQNNFRVYTSMQSAMGNSESFKFCPFKKELE
ncbi:CLUMA_CG016638, isoform A [Clunio marinus]|uniref:CLUMA_CG016638, isoform A n=1 Tax=Clunio marinus TaxID=568069 RepID=A0A1J1IX24_9DIPT|nr:CLUMA_CG016638, isoform A [Clunio marinus]